MPEFLYKESVNGWEEVKKGQKDRQEVLNYKTRYYYQDKGKVLISSMDKFGKIEKDLEEVVKEVGRR